MHELYVWMGQQSTCQIDTATSMGLLHMNEAQRKFLSTVLHYILRVVTGTANHMTAKVGGT
jgi:hypothetical protein